MDLTTEILTFIYAYANIVTWVKKKKSKSTNNQKLPTWKNSHFRLNITYRGRMLANRFANVRTTTNPPIAHYPVAYSPKE